MSRLILKVGHLEMWGIGNERNSNFKLYVIIDSSTENRWSLLFESKTQAKRLLLSGSHINSDGKILENVGQ